MSSTEPDDKRARPRAGYVLAPNLPSDEAEGADVPVGAGLASGAAVE